VVRALRQASYVSVLHL